jgi:hypothetical protein
MVYEHSRLEIATRSGGGGVCEQTEEEVSRVQRRVGVVSMRLKIQLQGVCRQCM